VETDIHSPLNVYGASKLLGEQSLATTGCQWTILRLEWTYGSGGNNFVRKILERAKLPGEMKVVSDQVGSPTPTIDVAETIAVFIEQPLTGLFHYAANGYASRYEVAKFILKESKIDREIIPCLTSDFPWQARRPLNSRFCCAKFDGSHRKLHRSNWDSALADFLRHEML
jgi:dTDP-4-dehydrorhamnose reductase